MTDSNDWLAMYRTAPTAAWVNFTVPARPGPPRRPCRPSIPNNWNGLTWIRGGENFAASVKVIDLDGVAFDGSSHTVKVTPPPGESFPDGSSEKYAGFDGSAGPTAAYYYWLYVGGGTSVYRVNTPSR